MSRTTVSKLMSDLSDYLTKTFGIAPTIRYARTQELADVPKKRLYFLEFGSFEMDRINPGSPCVVQTIRLLSESSCAYGELEKEYSDTIDFFERVARDFIKTPTVIAGTFIKSIKTFGDAPTFATSSARDGVSALFGGIEITFTM